MLIVARHFCVLLLNRYHVSLKLILMFNTHITLCSYSIYNVYKVLVIFCQRHSLFMYISMVQACFAKTKSDLMTARLY